MDQFVLKFKSLLMDLQYLKGHYPSVGFKFKLIRTSFIIKLVPLTDI